MADKVRELVAIIMPAYNEGSVIAGVVKDLKDMLNKHGINADIIVINDGSNDNTAAQAKKGGAIVINHIVNLGAGGATATGLGYASDHGYKIAVSVDADGQHAPKDVIQGIKAIKKSEADLLIGSRLINPVEMSKTKKLGNRGLSLITYILFGVNVADSQSGLRVFSRPAIENLRWKTNGFEFCSEMIWRARQQGLIVAEYPIKVVYSDYSMAKGQSNWNGVNILKSLITRRIVELFE